jgi:solute carrier family 25 protein 34/35
MFDPIMKMMHDSKKGRAPGWKRVMAGSLCGVMGAVSCNPFELVKTRLQSAATGSLAVGHQHNYTGVWQALKSIYSAEGMPGLYRGSLLSMSRSIVGSGANLGSFSIMKEYLMERNWKDDAILDMVCGLSSGVISCIFMNPIDVVRTRYYNQPYTNGKGALYSSGFDAMQKIWTIEGPKAFYKGFITHFLRIGPHFCLTFVFLGMLRRSTADAYNYLDRKDSFQIFDSNRDGKLDAKEVEDALKKVLADKSQKQVLIINIDS